MKTRVLIGIMAVVLMGKWVSHGQQQEQEVVLSDRMKAAVSRYEEGLKWMETGDHEAARKAFESVIADVGAMPDRDAKRLLSFAANNAGSVLILQGKPKEAERFLRKAVEANPEHAMAINNLGVSLLKQARIDEAVSVFEKAVTAGPELVEPLKNLCEVMLELGKLKTAGEYATAGLKLSPDDQRLLILLAKVYERANKPERQEKVWNRLVQATDGSVDARLILATHYLKEGVYSQAEAMLAEILRERPVFPEAQLQKARLFAVTNRKPEAEELFRRLLVEHSGDAVVRSDLAALLADSGRLEGALALAREGTEKFPQEAENWFVLGVCQERLQKYAAAADAYGKAVAADPRHARAWNNRGLLAARENDVDGAIRDLSAALAVEPFYADARYNLGRMLVISKRDFDRGVALVAGVAGGEGESSKKARLFLDDLKRVAKGEDPGWGNRPAAE